MSIRPSSFAMHVFEKNGDANGNDGLDQKILLKTELGLQYGVFLQRR